MTANRRENGIAVSALVAAIGLGAFLLFEIEFVVARWLLPWFGGAASVWTTCMLFFQTGLLAGYVWAHGVATKLSARRQAVWHMALVGLALVLLASAAVAWPSPVTPGASWRPAPGAEPIGGLLLLLSVSVGLPFVVLSSTGPLLQSWFTRLRPEASPWKLYALSNLGSLLGVLLYPIVIEPLLPVPVQGRVWTAMFGVYALCVGVAAAAQRESPEPAAAVGEATEGAGTRKSSPAFWWALSIATSLGLLSVTSQLTLDVAVVPFLWTVPLMIYLGTFIWAFSAPGRFSRPRWGALLALASLVAGVVYALTHKRIVALPWQVLTWLGFLFFLCAFGHGELASRKPAVSRLTAFYLAIAGGGAVGGLIAAVAAPLLFKGIWELPISLYAGLLLPILSLVEEGKGALFATEKWRRALLAGAGLLLFGSAVALTLTINGGRRFEIASARNFYGYLQVMRGGVPMTPPEPALILYHGRVVHGMQLESPRYRLRPTAYFGPRSGVGRVFAAPNGRAPMRVGVVGLGVGTLAAYGLPGDVFRFYELDPAVIALSRPPEPVFTFLAQSRATIDVVPGDARLSLEREAPQAYDLLVLDAFSSDAVPVHLLTMEAFDVYLRHLRGPDSVIAIHVTNRNLRLGPVVRGAAQRHGLEAAELFDDGGLVGTSPSTWVLATKDPGFFARRVIASAVLPLSRDHLPFWTDTSSNLLLSLWVFAGDEAALYPTHRAAR